MQFRAALSVAVHKVVKKGVARKDHRSRPATVPGRPSGQRAVPTVQQFPFALGRTVPARRPPVLARRVPAHPGEQHAVQQAVLGQAVFGEVLEEVLEELLAAVEVTTGRVREAMQNLADPPAQTRDALEYYGHYAASAPRELSGEFSWGGAEGPDGDLTLSVCYSGDPKNGEKLLQPLRTGVKARADSIRLQDYVVVQRQYDGPPLSSQNQYLKGGYVANITPAFIDTLMNEVKPNPLLSIVLEHCGGAISDVATNATALAHRSEQFQLLAAASWNDPADNEANRARVHAAWDKISKFTNGFYVNLNTADQKAVDDNYGPNRARLSALKKAYDPANLFRLNANIRPSA